MSLISIIIHDLPRTRKSQFVPGQTLQIGRVIFEQLYILPEPDVVLPEFDDIFLNVDILRPHPIVFYHSHITQDARDEKVEQKNNTSRNKDVSPAGAPGLPFSFQVVPFTHGYGLLQPRRQFRTEE